MSTQISEAFVKQFQADVHLAYQQTGSNLKNMVRSQNNVKGSSTVFQKVGKGVASGKARHGLVPVKALTIRRSSANCRTTMPAIGLMLWMNSR